MDFWISGEVQDDIDEPFARACQTIETAIGDAVQDQDYGPGLASWDVIAMIFGEAGPKEYKEVRRYNRGKRDCDIRLRIDYRDFKRGDDRRRIVLLLQMLLRSLDILEEMGVPDFDFQRLHSDIRNTAADHHWIDE